MRFYNISASVEDSQIFQEGLKKSKTSEMRLEDSLAPQRADISEHVSPSGEDSAARSTLAANGDVWIKYQRKKKKGEFNSARETRSFNSRERQ